MLNFGKKDKEYQALHSGMSLPLAPFYWLREGNFGFAYHCPVVENMTIFRIQCNRAGL